MNCPICNQKTSDLMAYEGASKKYHRCENTKCRMNAMMTPLDESKLDSYQLIDDRGEVIHILESSILHTFDTHELS